MVYCYCMKWHVLKLQCDVFALHCVTKLLYVCIWDGILPQVHGVQRPIDRQHVGDQLGACCIDLGVILVRVLDGEAFQRIVGLQSITESANTFDAYFVPAQVCAFQRPIEQ